MFSFSAKNTWLENQIFWSIRYFLKLLKKFILTQVQIIKPVRSSKCLNFAPRHSPFSMEDVQHYNQAYHYQQNRNGQSDHQVDEVLICRCRNKPEMTACQEMNIFHIQLKVWKKKIPENSSIAYHELGSLVGYNKKRERKPSHLQKY